MFFYGYFIIKPAEAFKSLIRKKLLDFYDGVGHNGGHNRNDMGA